MGSKSAVTLIDNIRINLDEKIDSEANKIIGTYGTRWTQTELLEALNKGKDRLWDLFRSVKEDYFLTIANTSVTLSATAKTYSLPPTYRQLRGIKVTQSGYEYIKFRAGNPEDREWQDRDAMPSGDTAGLNELLYMISGTGTLRLADFPPASLTTSIDFIAWLADYTLATNSTTDIPDEWAEWMEAYATRKALMKFPTDPRLATWEAEMKALTPKVTNSISFRQIKDSEYVEPYDPY